MTQTFNSMYRIAGIWFIFRNLRNTPLVNKLSCTL